MKKKEEKTRYLIFKYLKEKDKWSLFSISCYVKNRLKEYALILGLIFLSISVIEGNINFILLGTIYLNCLLSFFMILLFSII